MKVFHNKEKEFHEIWTKERNKANFPHPFRCLIAGPPNCGKTNMIHNLISFQEPPFQKIFIMHPDPENKEYENIKYKHLEDIPNKKLFIKTVKNLLIIDDSELKNLRKNEEINKLFSHVSTHRNLSIIISTQDITSQLFITIPRMSNIFIIFKYHNVDCIQIIANKIGIGKKDLVSIMLENMIEPHDSLCFDRTLTTKYPLRKNLFTLLEKIEY